MFESVLVQAPQDNAAVEISYETGRRGHRAERRTGQANEGRLGAEAAAKQMLKSNARLDMMLFERVRDEISGATKAMTRNVEGWARSIRRDCLNVVGGLRQIDGRVADRSGLGGACCLEGLRVEG